MATAAEARTLQNYIAGQWREAGTRESLEDRDPATGDLAARVPLSGAADVDAAGRGARAAPPPPAGGGAPRRGLPAQVPPLGDAWGGLPKGLPARVPADMGKTLAD